VWAGRGFFPKEAVVKTAKQLVSRFVKGEEGVSLLEYGLLAALIAVVCIVAIANIGTKINTGFETIDGKL
jgi:pilus assembly protein Flp/PilA